MFIFKLLVICICCLKSRESSDDDQTDWKPKTDNHCVKIKKKHYLIVLMSTYLAMMKILTLSILLVDLNKVSNQRNHVI